jgi:hypothetical protein
MLNSAAAAYNLFRNRQLPDIYCAVPEDRPLARFLAGEGWEYTGRLDEEATYVPEGFRWESAEKAAHFNGCYLFQAIRFVDRKRLAQQIRILCRPFE